MAAGNPGYHLPGEEPLQQDSMAEARSRLRLAVVCSSNQNRSMEAHHLLRRRGFLRVRSFGTGTYVRLPGPTPSRPNVYDFQTTYEQMYQDLVQKDEDLYRQTGILGMLQRNKRIKPRPERFQNCSDEFDLILTCEQRVFCRVVRELDARERVTWQRVHVINVDILDDDTEAILGSFLLFELCQCILLVDNMDEELVEVLQLFKAKLGLPFLHAVCFY
ncbi:RNA polymerase II subunit A C-terminal domain phosphatase SSU72-like [Myotis daubentonii]|uniref:RNA polymerase II subunit A C-terminal domain phosphatase SSU72-like n=1 Tax=Myotis daubentonii TaxID=98922 RepID=UPI002873D1D9|nr:RNA polymerase II subunit A C-terminal domain phosphatase SSU72-like [Myotis daubentonii]XP_059534644.1 RNA polymerase II subunit A C-terminal domain phosphatase SSU72-like [Myotis daubentonii]XP_059534645.1 RNA polymerase II subunit A C-terminal domain phosphatase SSU72-like [Myotis daubentonii]